MRNDYLLIPRNDSRLKRPLVAATTVPAAAPDEISRWRSEPLGVSKSTSEPERA